MLHLRNRPNGTHKVKAVGFIHGKYPYFVQGQLILYFHMIVRQRLHPSLYKILTKVTRKFYSASKIYEKLIYQLNISGCNCVDLLIDGVAKFDQ